MSETKGGKPRIEILFGWNQLLSLEKSFEGFFTSCSASSLQTQNSGELNCLTLKGTNAEQITSGNENATASNNEMIALIITFFWVATLHSFAFVFYFPF